MGPGVVGLQLLLVLLILMMGRRSAPTWRARATRKRRLDMRGEWWIDKMVPTLKIRRRGLLRDGERQVVSDRGDGAR